MVWGLCKSLLLSMGSTYYPQADTEALNARTCMFFSHLVSLHARYGRHNEKIISYLWDFHLHLQKEKQEGETQPREMINGTCTGSQKPVPLPFDCNGVRLLSMLQHWARHETSKLNFYFLSFISFLQSKWEGKKIFEGKKMRKNLILVFFSLAELFSRIY